MPVTVDRRTSLWLGSVAFIALSALGHHTWGTVDAIQRLALTRSVLTSGSVITEEFGPIKYGPTQSALMLPTYAIGYGIGVVSGAADPGRIGYRVTAFLFTPLLLSCLIGTWFTLGRWLGVSVLGAGLGSWSLLWCTLVMPYSRLLFSEILTAFLLVWAVVAFLPLFRGETLRPGGFFPLGVASLNYLMLSPLLVLATVVLPSLEWRRGRHREAFRLGCAGLIACVATAACWLLYNQARYGSALTFGYMGERFTTPFLRGIYGLLASPGRGLIFYSVPSVVALVILSRRLLSLRRPFPWGDAVVFAVFSFYLLLYAHWGSFEGGWCWGPRFLLPFVPLLHLAFLSHLDHPTKASRWLIGGSLAAGFLVNAWEYSTEWPAFEKATFGDGKIDYLRSVFELQFVSALHGYAGWTTIERLLQFFAVAGFTTVGTIYLLRRASRNTS